MRRDSPRYPVDRYLVESSNKIEMVNIIDDELWSPEPALKPEDEIILRKLHEMLQSTADDLKMLSSELSKSRQPGVQYKTQPMPLDEEFNEKVHIEEIVNAKFHGYTIIEHPRTTSANKAPAKDAMKSASSCFVNPKVSAAVQVDAKQPVCRNLGITKIKSVHIEGQSDECKKNDDTKLNRLNNTKVINNVPAVAYNEYSFKDIEPKVKKNPHNLQKQNMPSINIRSELKEQKVLQIDIIPEDTNKVDIKLTKNNVGVIAVDHDTELERRSKTAKENCLSSSVQRLNPPPIRKISKLSSCESTGSTNNLSSDTQHKLVTQKQVKRVIKSSPRPSGRVDRNKINKAPVKSNVRALEKRSHSNLDEWKRKLNIVYGQPSSSRSKIFSKSNVTKTSPKKSNLAKRKSSTVPRNLLNNAEYIPYSKLTLGGVRLSDIEKELSDSPIKNDLPLSPMLDKIISSRENSTRNTPRKPDKNSGNILTTSDENLLQEVIDIERTVSKTLSKTNNKHSKSHKNKILIQKVDPKSGENSQSKEDESYADDFEDDKTDNTDKNSQSNAPQSDKVDSNNTENDPIDDFSESNETPRNVQNTSNTKATNLSFKDSVDVFEFVHSVDTQDTATQSNTTHKISLKETQTSPRNDKPNIQPIRNELWPMDPKGEVEKMFMLEKDLIKKLIIEEYGDLLQKNLDKPSTSKNHKHETTDRNIVAFQKNTQTSPAHVKNVMTSPTRTKTRTTSPFLLAVDQQTSPMVVVAHEEHLSINLENEADSISINLCSPRFSLRLPQTSRDVLSNLGDHTVTPPKIKPGTSAKKLMLKSKKVQKSSMSSSSIDGDHSSSEISSLGEVKLKLKKRLKKRIPVISESSSASSKYSSDVFTGMLPLKSEGEMSQGQKKSKSYKSEGEASMGQQLK